LGEGGNKIFAAPAYRIRKHDNLGEIRSSMLWRTLVSILFVVGICTWASCGSASGNVDKTHTLPPLPAAVKKNVGLDTSSLTASEKRKAWQLDTLFLAKVKRTHFNGNVLIAQNGRIIYEKCFGYEDYKAGKKLCTASSFQLASSSKPMTAAAIMILKERGKLDYSDDLTKYIPDFPYLGITIRMLLNHRSGLPNYEYFMENYVNDHATPLNNEEVLKIMIKNKPEIYSKPNKHFSYNNSNYLLLAVVVEKASGTDYRSFMKKEIFDVCGMSCTFIPDRKKDTLRPMETRNYKGSLKWELTPFNFLDGVLGDKGIYSTTEDLYRFERAMAENRLLKAETLEEAYKGGSNEKKGARNYGFGWRLTDQPDGSKIIYHNGWWHGYNSVFMRRPKDQTTVIVLTNKYNTNTYHVKGVWEILDGKGVNVEEKPEE
jgi:CubicO group peptidase (beta-lactamase class C family)